MLLRNTNEDRSTLNNEPSFLAYSTAFILMIFFSSIFNSNVPKIKVFSVGHGGCIMTIYKNISILFDCGSLKYESYLADKILKELFKKNISKLKHIVISHMHSDHLNGFFKLSKYINVQFIYYSTNKVFSTKMKKHFLNHPSKPKFITSDQEIFLDNSFHIKLLTQHINDSTNENDSSLCSQLIYKDFTRKKKTSLLITGDIEKNGICAFDKYYSENLDIDFMSWPHHGSTRINPYAFTNNTVKIIQCNSRDKGIKRKNALKITRIDFDFRLDRKLFADDLLIYRKKIKKMNTSHKSTKTQSHKKNIKNTLTQRAQRKRNDKKENNKIPV